MRVDDYKNAWQLTAKELLEKDPKQVANIAGAKYLEETKQIEIDFCGRTALLTWPEMTIHWADNLEEEFSLTDGVLILHYLNGAHNGGPLSGEIVAYRQIPGGEFYFSAFRSRAEIPLAKVFTHAAKHFDEAAKKFGGQPAKGYGDWGAVFRPLPRLAIVLSAYEADDEFEATGQALFDKNIEHYLHIEDISWLASALVYRVIGYAGHLNKG